MRKERENKEQSQELKANQTTVSFIDSGTPSRQSNRSGITVHREADDIPHTDNTSRIRRMSDSTRAREAEKNKKKGKPSAGNYTYEKERPDGEYEYSEIHNAKKYKKRKKFSRQDDLTAMATETLQLDLRDIIPVAVPPQETVKPVNVPPAPRASRTSMNLSSSDRGTLTADSLDVTIQRTPEEAVEETRRRQKSSDKMNLEKTADIRSDIAELRSAVVFRAGGLMAAAVISAYLALRHVFHITLLDSIPENLICLMQVLLGLAAASVCVPALKNGLGRLFQFRADTDTFAATAWLACMLDSLSGIFGVQHNGLAMHFMPCAIFILLLHTLGKLLSIDREEINLKSAINTVGCYGLHIVENDHNAELLTKGMMEDFPVIASMRKTESLKDFRKYTYSADLADYFSHYCAPASCAFSLIASIILTLFSGGGIGYFFGLFSMFSVATGCAAITFSVNLPLFNAVKKLASHNTLLLGYQSVDDFYDTDFLLIDASAMFPESAVKLKGVKMYSNIRSEETLLAAASLARHAGSCLSHLFNEVLQNKEHYLYQIEKYSCEDGVGLCGWIHNQIILLGTRELMIRHHVEGLPSKTKEDELTGEGRDAIYLSISGNLSALFVIELQADNLVSFWTQQAKKHNISLIIHNVDPIITAEKIASLFDMPQDMLNILPAKLKGIYQAETAPIKEMSTSAACTNDFSNIMRLVTCAKIVRNAATAGLFIQAVSILIGLVLVVMESLLHIGVTASWMIIFECAVSLITILCVNIRRMY